MKKVLVLVVALVVFIGNAYALTPAEETVCDEAALTGAAWGLCNAYCEAMDCDSDTPKASSVACDKIVQKFAKITSGDVLPCETNLSPDIDGDGVPDDIDNCPETINENQMDVDQDEIGDVCDNCPYVSNVHQIDSDQDQIGDICDCPCQYTAMQPEPTFYQSQITTKRDENVEIGFWREIVHMETFDVRYDDTSMAAQLGSLYFIHTPDDREWGSCSLEIIRVIGFGAGEILYDENDTLLHNTFQYEACKNDLIDHCQSTAICEQLAQ
jgi:thrombospondin type 3 repeat protein